MKKKWLAVLIICMALMFDWIFLAVALTGGRDVADFTQQDKQIMIGFAVAEFVTVAVMIVSACILGKQVGRSMPKTEPVSLTKAEIARKRTGALLLWGPLALDFAAQIGGIFLWKQNDAWVTGGQSGSAAWDICWVWWCCPWCRCLPWCSRKSILIR